MKINVLSNQLQTMAKSIMKKDFQGKKQGKNNVDNKAG